MLRDMTGVGIEAFVPGTVVAVENGLNDCVAVVFNREAWAVLAAKEYRLDEARKIACDPRMITLRVLGGVRMSTAKHEEWMQGTEPNDKVIRNYCHSNVGGDIRIVDNLIALQDAYFLFARVHHLTPGGNASFDLEMLRKYLAGDHNGEFLTDNMYGCKMLALFKEGIPL